MVNRIDGMKLVIMSLVSAAPALSNVCILLFSVFLIFGILGLSLFMGEQSAVTGCILMQLVPSGKFHSCNDAEDEFIGGSNKSGCFGHFEGDFWGPRVPAASTVSVPTHNEWVYIRYGAIPHLMGLAGVRSTIFGILSWRCLKLRLEILGKQ